MHRRGFCPFVPLGFVGFVGFIAVALALGCGGDELGTASATETDGATASATGETDNETTTETAGESETEGELLPPYDGELLPEVEVGEWIWVDFPEARCRDGSTTGIGVRYGLENKLMIFFEGGGACFNTLTCQLNPAHYSGAQFDGWKDGGGRRGIFDPENPDNPVGEWSAVYIPYCTGDVHAGVNADATVSGVGGTQQFVGYHNVERYLERVVPTFFDAEHVLVTGVSAGGFGAALNFDRMAESFLKSEVTLLDDSGPPMDDPYLASCLQRQWRDTWGFDEVLPQECDACFQDDGGGLTNLAPFLGDKHRDSVLALISTEADDVIRTFFGFGGNNCTALIPNMSAAEFREGLYELRENGLKGASAGAWGSFFIPGTAHTFLGGSSVYTTEVSGMLLIDWITDLLVRDPQHISP